MENYFVNFNNASKVYKAGEYEIRALDGLSFGIKEGEFVVIVGASGAGKTTLLNLLGGMDFLTDGEIIVANDVISKLNQRQLDRYRRHDVGFVFQFYNLMPNLTAKENIELAVEICKNAFKPDEILEKVGLSDRASNFPAQLSGGEQQRVSIARAIAKNPKILLCDEPTGALDYETGKKILKLLHELCRSQNKTVVVVTHNSALCDIADRVITIKNGKTTSCITNKIPKSIEEIEW